MYTASKHVCPRQKKPDPDDHAGIVAHFEATASKELQCNVDIASVVRQYKVLTAEIAVLSSQMTDMDKSIKKVWDVLQPLYKNPVSQSAPLYVISSCLL